VKAVLVRQFGPVENACVEECPDPTPGAGEIVIDVEAADTNYADLLVIEGRYQMKPPLPFTPGKAAAGRIAALGADVEGLRIGERVAAQIEYGAYAGKLRVSAACCYPIPDSIGSIDAAALVLTYQTAWWGLTDRARFEPGETVLVTGAGGGVGVAAIGMAKALGAGLVIGATRGSGKAEAIRKAGADHVIDLSQPDLIDALRNEVRQLTAGKGVDVVFDSVGGAVAEAALRALAWRGRLIVVGFTANDIPSVRTNYLLVRNIALIGLQASDYRDRWPALAARAQAEIFRLAVEGRLKPMVSEVLPLGSFAEALAKLRDGKVTGKIVLKIDAF
jgi:NADPH:quinone reductase